LIKSKLNIFLFFIPFFFLGCLSDAVAQIGGRHIYEFLEAPTSARITALGGLQIALPDDDIAMGYQNPALYDSLMHKKVQLGHQLFFAGISNGYVATAFQLQPKLVVSAGLQYITYGQFQQTDVAGNNLGAFSGSEFALHAGASYKIKPKIKVGANLKLIGSYLYQYQSYGVGVDVGVAYTDTAKNFTAGLVVKNAGLQLVKYNEDRESLPFDLQIGLSKRLKYVPFRFGVTLHHLHQWNIRYDDPALEDSTPFLNPDEVPKEKKFFVDKLFRHVNLSGEFYLGKIINFRFGYNHLKRRELLLSQIPGLTGFSGGVGIELKRLSISYGKAFYTSPASTNHFTFEYQLK